MSNCVSAAASWNAGAENIGTWTEKCGAKISGKCVFCHEIAFGKIQLFEFAIKVKRYNGIAEMHSNKFNKMHYTLMGSWKVWNENS